MVLMTTSLKVISLMMAWLASLVKVFAIANREEENDN
jgi:hypothetical protein